MLQDILVQRLNYDYSLYLSVILIVKLLLTGRILSFQTRPQFF